MTIDTHHLRDDEWRSTIPPAEAATEVGAEDADKALPEGFAVAFIAVVACALSALGIVHLLASVL